MTLLLGARRLGLAATVAFYGSTMHAVSSAFHVSPWFGAAGRRPPPGASLSRDWTCRRREAPLGLSSSTDDDDETNAHNQVQEMEELILELSHEARDDVRRERLEALFEKELPNDSFANLFDKVLIVVGDRVRAEAMQAAEAAKVESSSKGDEDGDALPSFPPSGQTSPTGNQLWALVDMMVQSKTIVKKASGQLGSEGTFG